MYAEKIDTVVVFEDNITPAFFDLDEDSDELRIRLTFKDKILEECGDTFFEALNKLRDNLYKENIHIKCYGTCENVFPSRMSLDMGTGRMAYVLEMGKQAKAKDLVDIFESKNNIVPVTVQVQADFYGKWLNSLR